MVNTKLDTTSYESCSYKRDIFNADALYDAYLRAKKESDWKPQVQRYEMNYLFELAHTQNELMDRTYSYLPSIRFVISERGKTRVINGEQMRDRVVKHSLCDEVLNPGIRKYLIYDNGASLKGKGISFTRKRLLTHLQKYYRQYGNEGYILLIDYSKYYDNIRHDVLMSQFRKYIHDPTALWLLEMTLDMSKVDVSYMTDEEYSGCMERQFNSLEYENHKDSYKLNGTKYMRKHLNIGDQVAQVAGILYPTPIDNYIKIVRGVKYYARYMDDSYVIHQDREFLEQLLQEIIVRAKEIGITVNEKKTHIAKLSDYWRFLQIQYSLTSTGRIVKKINPKRLTCMRRKMKKLVWVMSEKEFEDWFNAWFENYCKYMSKLQRQNVKELFKKLKEDKRLCTQLHCQTEHS